MSDNLNTLSLHSNCITKRATTDILHIFQYYHPKFNVLNHVNGGLLSLKWDRFLTDLHATEI
jgi:hypothetical protein